MEIFNPVDYSTEENKFLKVSFGKSPGVAFADGLPQGVIASQVRPILQHVKDLVDMERPWVGIPTLIEAIEQWEKTQAEAAEMHRRGAPRWPSMHSYDAKGRPHRGGPGADSHTVQTYFDEHGTRQRLAVQLDGNRAEGWVAPWARTAIEAPRELIEHPNRVECAICHHTEQFKEDSAASARAARARMSKHMKSADVEPELHREYKLNVFGS